MNQLWILSLCAFSTVLLVLTWLGCIRYLYEDHVAQHGHISAWNFWDHGFLILFVLLVTGIAIFIGTIVCKFAADALYVILAQSLGYISHP